AELLPSAAAFLADGPPAPPRRWATMIRSPSITPSLVISRFLPSESPITTCCGAGFPATSFQIVTLDPGAPATGCAAAPPEDCTTPAPKPPPPKPPPGAAPAVGAASGL